MSGPWRTSAFGLEVEGDFPAPGLDLSPSAAAGAPRTHVALVESADLLAHWPRAAARVLYGQHADAPPKPVLLISHSAEAGYLLEHAFFGAYRVTSDGSQVLAAPPQLPPWRWQRFLIGQVLPLAAVLRGLEIFHASAVAVAGRAVLFMGPSGSGKTTLALGSAMAGAAFLTDDVVAVSRPRGLPTAHPGAAVASLDADTVRRMQGAWGREPGMTVGSEGEESRIVVGRDDASRPIELVYLLQRRREGRQAAIASLDGPEPRRLLGSTFNAYVDTPERLTGQLETCSALSRTARFFTLEPGDSPLAKVVQEVKAHAEGVLGVRAQ